MLEGTTQSDVVETSKRRRGVVRVPEMGYTVCWSVIRSNGISMDRTYWTITTKRMAVTIPANIGMTDGHILVSVMVD